jgi:hypothetical protein
MVNHQGAKNDFHKERERTSGSSRVIPKDFFDLKNLCFSQGLGALVVQKVFGLNCQNLQKSLDI